MRVLIQDYASKHFYGSDNSWVHDPRRAVRFESFAQAAEFAREHELQDRRVLSCVTEEELLAEKPHQAEFQRRLSKHPASRVSFSRLASSGWYP